AGQRGKLVVRGTVVERARNCGICAYDSEIDVDATTVRDIDAQAANGTNGFGVVVGPGGLDFGRAAAVVRRSGIARAHSAGLIGLSADLTVESLLVSETGPSVADDTLGRGISAENGGLGGSHLVLRGSVVERSHEAGVLVLGSHADIETTLVRETLS